MVRIGELARRTGVTVELLRAWEHRYGLLEPARSAGGFRLYSAADEQRVHTMTGLIATGVSAAEAAARARSAAGDVIDGETPAIDGLAAELSSALDRFDSDAAHEALDRLFATVSIEAVMSDVLVPYLRRLGDRWAAGEVTIAQEHFASNLLRGRLMSLAHGWSSGSGPAYVIACPSGEEHDLASVMFGLALARRGARVVFLGADTPAQTIADAARDTDPAGVVLSLTRPEVLLASAEELGSLAATLPVYVCGRGADRADVERIGAQPLEGDPVTAARRLSRR
jgi:DNA-binding transcriptional MerR regulator